MAALHRFRASVAETKRKLTTLIIPTLFTLFGYAQLTISKRMRSTENMN